jgi:hypothetical protein
MSISRVRHNELPPEPNDWRSFVIPQNLMTTLSQTQFCHDFNFPGFRILLFVTDGNLQRLSAADVWLMDGTFKTVPTVFKQLYTIHAKVGGINGRILPLVYALMTSKSKRCYRHLFEELKRLATNANIQLDPSFVISDLERSAINAIKEAFPRIQNKGCHFHLAQIIWRAIGRFGLVARYREDRQFSLNLRHLVALAYLEPNDILQAFRDIRRILPPVARFLLKWFNKNYVNGNVRTQTGPKFPPDMWSVSENNDGAFPRTNNNVEAWHMKWLIIVGSSHLGLFKVINHIREEQRDNESIFLRIERGEPAPKKNLRDRRREERLQNIIENRRVGNIIDDMTFLRRIARNLALE